MRSLELALIQYGWCSYEKRLGHRHTQSEDYVKTWGEDGHQGEKSSEGMSPADHLDLRLPVSGTVRDYISVV